MFKGRFARLQDWLGLMVIVHGYDYPVKLNDSNKGWLGRYMIAVGNNWRCGISSGSERCNA